MKPLNAMTALAVNAALQLDLSPFGMGQDARDFAAERLRTRVMRKLTIKGDTSAADSNALAKFLDANSKCAEWVWTQATKSDAMFDDEFRHFLYRGLSGYALGHNLKDDQGLGPGASRGCKTNDAYTKLYDSCLTTTSAGLYNRYVHSLLLAPIADTPQGPRNSLLDAEKQRIRNHGKYQLVEGCKLSFVPKDSATSRVICTEPLLNMLCQKAVGKFLERQLKSIFLIELSSQPDINNRMAFKGSVDRQWATVDLRSASDSISVPFAKWCVPASFWRVLSDTRSPNVELPDGSQVALNMVSGMGNGFTFPFQTLIFASIVHTVYKTLGLKAKVHVFGDDMVVVAEAIPLLYHALERYGFTVNTDKSFHAHDDPFRESCGGDYYQGVAVKPVYIRELASLSDLYSAFNRLRLWSIYHKVPLYRTLLLLRRLIGETDHYLPFGSSRVEWSIDSGRFLTVTPLGASIDVTGDVTAGIMCTRRQAARHSKRRICPNMGVFHSRLRTEVQETPEFLQRNPLGAVLAAVSGRAQSVHRDCLLGLTPKQKQVHRRSTTDYTSVWEVAEVISAALYKSPLG